MSKHKSFENGNGGKSESAAEFGVEFKPKTESDLIENIKWLKSNEENSHILSRHQLGKMINNFYEKKYGNDELRKIAEASGYSKSTLHKSCQFANNFSDKKVGELLSGRFQISWRDIAQNLRVNPDDFVKAYSESATANEFRNAVTELKDPDEMGIKLRRTYSRKKGHINYEYQLLMKNQLEYRDFQLSIKEREIAELKGRIAELMAELAKYEKEMSKNKMTDEIADVMDKNLAAMAA